MSWLASIFTSTPDLSGPMRLLLMLPLSLSIAVVYKTIRLEHLAEVPRAALVLWLTIVGGMSAVGVGLWLLYWLLL